MFKNPRRLTRQLLRAAIAKKTFLALVMAVLLLSTATTVYANVIFWRGTGTDYYGRTNEYFLSCGSSAGNYFYSCDHNGNCTDLGSNGANQACYDEGY